VLVLQHGGQIVLAGLLVDQADDECPHDRTPLLIDPNRILDLFQAGFVGAGKWFREGVGRQPRARL
jgi:hypothetical protein